MRSTRTETEKNEKERGKGKELQWVLLIQKIRALGRKERRNEFEKRDCREEVQHARVARKIAYMWGYANVDSPANSM